MLGQTPYYPPSSQLFWLFPSPFLSFTHNWASLGFALRIPSSSFRTTASLIQRAFFSLRQIPTGYPTVVVNNKDPSFLAFV